MSTYRLLGLNLWTYSERRAIGWIGNNASHHGEKKHYLQFEVGPWGHFGIEVTVGGEDMEVQFRIGLGFAVLYVALAGIVPDRYDKAKEIAANSGCYAYELDYSSQGRTSGMMVNFRHGLSVAFSLWNNSDSWTSKSIRQKFDGFPYCEGVSKTFYIINGTA